MSSVASHESVKRLVLHKGGCHCGAVRFQLAGVPSQAVYRCNCSVCAMRGNVHFVVPQQMFELLTGMDHIALYRFNTGVAKHLFCNRCGVVSFYIPRSNPDGVAITYLCLDRGTFEPSSIVDFDGQNWEKEIKGSAITKDSKMDPATETGPLDADNSTQKDTRSDDEVLRDTIAVLSERKSGLGPFREQLGADGEDGSATAAVGKPAVAQGVVASEDSKEE